MLWLIRHAAAKDRYQFEGDDQDRPLNKKGRRQAEAIGGDDRFIEAKLLLSSPAVRCLQTLAPLAHKLGIEVETHAALAEGAPVADGLALLRELRGTDAALCSHGDVIPELLRVLMLDGMSVVGSRGCAKASVWELEVVGRDIARGRYHEAPSSDRSEF